MTPIPHTCRRPRTQRNSNMLRRAAVCACPPFMARAEERAYAAQQKSKQVNGAECLFSFFFVFVFFKQFCLFVKMQFPGLTRECRNLAAGEHSAFGVPRHKITCARLSILLS